MKYRVAKILLVGMFLLALLLPGCSNNTSTSTSSSAPLTTVKVGIEPYTMFMLWPVAHEMGIDKEFGLNFDIMEFASADTANTALARGDIDIAGSAISFHMAAVKGAPQLIGFSSLSLFKGFIFVGRKGAIEPYSQLVQEKGATEAKKYRINEFKDKNFCIVAQNEALLLDTLSQVGLTLNDVKLSEFADDPAAATAFEQGTGDFYIGSLPQEQKLLGIPDKFINAGGTEILGPAGLWYDIMISTDKFMKDHKETALKTLAVMYKTVNFFSTRQQKFAEIAAEKLTAYNGATYSASDYITFQTEYDTFLTISDLKAGMYDPSSSMYWKNPAQYIINLDIQQKVLDSSVTADAYYGAQEALFKELLTRQDLMSKIGN
jgi:ABC-type nitrate/sulfonate/bicarbonate transport system substrate-binding protein